MRNRRFKGILLLLIVSMLLTGCRSVDKAKYELDKKMEEYKEAREEKARQKEKDKLTSDEYESIKDDLYGEAKGVAKGFNKFVTFWTGEDEATRWARKHQKEMDSRVHSKANDKELAEKEESGSTLQQVTKYLPLIIILVVIVLLVVLFYFLSKRSVSKPVRVVRASTPVPASTPAPTSVDQVNVKYAKVLRDNCQKLGLDYDSVLAQYGGDVVTAVNNTNLQIYRQ